MLYLIPTSIVQFQFHFLFLSTPTLLFSFSDIKSLQPNSAASSLTSNPTHPINTTPNSSIHLTTCSIPHDCRAQTLTTQSPLPPSASCPKPQPATLSLSRPVYQRSLTSKAARAHRSTLSLALHYLYDWTMENQNVCRSSVSVFEYAMHDRS